MRVDFGVLDMGEVALGIWSDVEYAFPLLEGDSKGKGCENVRLRLTASGRGDVPPPFDVSIVLAC